MFFERFTNSKFYHVLDQIVRVVWLNLLSLIFIGIGLFFFSFAPALLAGVYVIKLLLHKYEGSIFKVFFQTFKKFYKKATMIFMIYSVLIGLFMFNLFFFLEKLSVEVVWYDLILFLLTLLLLILSVPALIHSLLLYSCYEGNSIRSLIIDGFKLSAAFIIRGLLFMVSLFLVIYLTLIIPLALLIISWILLWTAIELLLFKAYDKYSVFELKSVKIAEQLASDFDR